MLARRKRNPRLNPRLAVVRRSYSSHQVQYSSACNNCNQSSFKNGVCGRCHEASGNAGARFIVCDGGGIVEAADDEIPTLSSPQAVLVPTERYPETPAIKGHDFNSGRDIDLIMSSMLTTGFQATSLGQAVAEINRMVSV